MKDKIMTAFVAATVLGAYSAGVYHFSSGGSVLTSTPEVGAMVPAPPDDSVHVDRIMRAMQTQGPSRVHTNLPVPGATCDITVSELATEYYSTDIEVDYCLDTVHAGLER